MAPIFITGYHDVSRALRGHDIQHVVSIGEVGSKTPHILSSHPARKVRLEFDDIEYERNLAGYEGPAMQDVEALLCFYEGIDLGEKVLIHCGAGVSRSSAATLLLYAQRLGIGHEDEAVSSLLRAKELTATMGLRDPHEYIRPNRRLVWLGDLALGHGGALLDACSRMDCYSWRWEPPGIIVGSFVE